MNKHLTVIDLSTLLPGPFSSYLLQKHLDVHVIKFEDINQLDALSNLRPTKDGIGLGYLGINKSKTIKKIDFRNNGLLEVLKEVKNADVVIENFKPGKADKLGLGFADVKSINPKIIYCSITGYPHNHPLSNKSAHDLNVLSLCGYLDQQYKLGTINVLPPLLIADIITSYNVVIQLLSKLLKNEYGTHLEVSMLSSFLESMEFNNYPQISSKQEFSSKDFIMSGIYPCYSVYDTKDNRKIAVAALEKSLWIDLCHHLKHEEWIDKQFDPGLREALVREILKSSQNDWTRPELDLCVTPVLTINEALRKNYV